MSFSLRLSTQFFGWTSKLCGLILFLGIGVMSLSGCRPAPQPGLLTPSAGPRLAQAQVVRLQVASEGMVEVSAQELKSAGFDLAGASLPDLQIRWRGQPRTVFVEGEGNARRLRFYADPVQSRYLTENVYLLSTGGAMVDQDLAVSDETSLPLTQTLAAPAALPADTYFAVTHAEQNKRYDPQVESGDHWLWAALPAPQKTSLDISLDASVAGPGRLAVELWASTEAAHHILARLNGQLISDVRWEGKGRHRLLADIPAGVLKQGSNQLELEAPGDTGAPADVSHLDWFEIGYPRRFQAREDRLDFISPGEATLHLSAFSAPPQVYDLSDPGQVKRVALGSDGRSFPAQTGRRYLVVGPQGYLKPLQIQPLQRQPDLRAAGSGADYVAIGPDDLLEPLGPLMDLRAQSGLKTIRIPVQAVYDQFNAGLAEPQAIRAFLRYATQNWQPAPRFVLLVGDGSYDPRGYLAPPEANRLPVFLVNTIYGGETASDVVYTQLEPGSARPSLAIGRIPARQPQQVATLVSKTLAFEKTLPALGQRHVLAVADGQEATFRKDAQKFLDQFSEDFPVELLAPPAGTTDANTQILARLQQGDWLVAYFGHGSINMWGKDRLFNTEDVARLANGDRLPVLFNFTCLNGLFTHPKVESLTEALLWQANGGAAVVLAPTSLTLPGDQGILLTPLVEKILQEHALSLGEALLFARQQTPLDQEGARDVMETFLLFGDPAVRINP